MVDFKILSHRGVNLSQGVDALSSVEMLTNALRKGLDVEIDLRLHKDEILISHDPICDGAHYVGFDELLTERSSKQKLFLNIKEDGIIEFLQENYSKSLWDDCFLFDMSIPEQCKAQFFELPYLKRLSKSDGVCFTKGAEAGCWFDWFIDVRYGFSDLDLNRASMVFNYSLGTWDNIVIVLPDVHGLGLTESIGFLDRIASKIISSKNVIWLLTDFPCEIQELYV